MESVFLLMMDERVYILPEHFLFRRKISRSPSLTMMMDQAGQGERENSKLQSNWLLVLTCTTWDFFCGDSKLMHPRKPFKFLI